MSIKSGRYIITHAQHWNLAFLSDANNETSLLGCLEQDVPGEEWNVKELQNGRYSITNFGHKMSASAVFQAQKGEHVVGRERGSVWLIKEHESGGTYTIATANDKLRWWLDESWPDTPITLNDAPPSDPRCHWTFHKIGRVNSAPYEAAKEEAAVVKAEFARKVTEVEKAKEEVEAYKSTFRSYFNGVSELNVDQYRDVLDKKWRPIQVSLFWAAEMGHDTAAELILAQNGVDVNSKLASGTTPLHLAAQKGHDAMVRLLLAQKGVNVNSNLTSGTTPLHLAAQNGHDVVVRLLLAQKGVNVNSRWYDKTPLYVAAENGHDVVVRLLLEHNGVDVNSNSDGRTPLLVASHRGHDVVVRLLLAQEGVDINPKGENGATPLNTAAGNGHDVVVRLLLEHKSVDINSKNGCGTTPLIVASLGGHDAVVRLLLGHKGVDVNLRHDAAGLTALMYAERYNHGVVARLLREKMGNAA